MVNFHQSVKIENNVLNLLNIKDIQKLMEQAISKESFKIFEVVFGDSDEKEIYFYYPKEFNKEEAINLLNMLEKKFSTDISYFVDNNFYNTLKHLPKKNDLLKLLKLKENENAE